MNAINAYPEINSLENIESFVMNHCKSESPDLTMISIIFGHFEYFAYENTKMKGKRAKCIDLFSLKKLHSRFLKIFKNKNLKKLLKIETSSKSLIVKLILDLIWFQLDGKYRKDKPHIQSVYSLLKLRQLDSLGVSICVVIACDILKITDVKLALTESHSWIIFGDENKDSMEVTWHGKATEDLRGLSVNIESSIKRWMYQGGRPMILSKSELIATIVSNMDIYAKDGTILPSLYSFKKKLLLFFYEHGILEKLPSSILMLSELTVIKLSKIIFEPFIECDTDELQPNNLYNAAIISANKYYDNKYVLPYISFGHFYFNDGDFFNAVEQWSKAALVISKFQYHKEDGNILLRFNEIMNKIIPKYLRKIRTFEENEKILYNILMMYDGICKWEEGSDTQLIHSLSVHNLSYIINKFSNAAKLRLKTYWLEAIEQSKDTTYTENGNHYNEPICKQLNIDTKPKLIIKDVLKDNYSFQESNKIVTNTIVSTEIPVYVDSFLQNYLTEHKLQLSSNFGLTKDLLPIESSDLKTNLFHFLSSNLDKFILNPNFFRQVVGLDAINEEFFRPFLDTHLRLNLNNMTLISPSLISKNIDNNLFESNSTCDEYLMNNFTENILNCDEVNLRENLTTDSNIKLSDIKIKKLDTLEKMSNPCQNISKIIDKTNKSNILSFKKATKRKNLEENVGNSKANLKLTHMTLRGSRKIRKSNADSVLTDASYIYNSKFPTDIIGETLLFKEQHRSLESLNTVTNENMGKDSLIYLTNNIAVSKSTRIKSKFNRVNSSDILKVNSVNFLDVLSNSYSNVKLPTIDKNINRKLKHAISMDDSIYNGVNDNNVSHLLLNDKLDIEQNINDNLDKPDSKCYLNDFKYSEVDIDGLDMTHEKKYVKFETKRMKFAEEDNICTKDLIPINMEIENTVYNEKSILNNQILKSEKTLSFGIAEINQKQLKENYIGPNDSMNDSNNTYISNNNSINNVEKMKEDSFESVNIDLIDSKSKNSSCIFEIEPLKSIKISSILNHLLNQKPDLQAIHLQLTANISISCKKTRNKISQI